MKAILAASLLALTLVGCASTGNQTLKDETEATVATKIHEGSTTKSDLKALYGSPLDTTFTDGGREIWEYSLTDISDDAVNYIPFVNLFGSSKSGTQKKLTVLFNDNDTVYKYSMTDSDYNVKTGIFK